MGPTQCQHHQLPRQKSRRAGTLPGLALWGRSGGGDVFSGLFLGLILTIYFFLCGGWIFGNFFFSIFSQSQQRCGSKHAYPKRWKAGRARYICWEFPADVAVDGVQSSSKRMEMTISAESRSIIANTPYTSSPSSFPFSHPLILDGPVMKHIILHSHELSPVGPSGAPSGSSGWTPPVVTGGRN